MLQKKKEEVPAIQPLQTNMRKFRNDDKLSKISDTLINYVHIQTLIKNSYPCPYRTIELLVVGTRMVGKTKQTMQRENTEIL